MCSLHFENIFLSSEGVRFASISKKTLLSKLPFAFVSLALPLLHLSEQGSVLRELTILHKSFWLGQERSTHFRKTSFSTRSKHIRKWKKRAFAFLNESQKQKGLILNYWCFAIPTNNKHYCSVCITHKDCSAENIYTRHQWTNSTKGKSQEWDSKQR
jgi:hypothetical protein